MVVIRVSTVSSSAALSSSSISSSSSSFFLTALACAISFLRSSRSSCCACVCVCMYVCVYVCVRAFSYGRHFLHGFRRNRRQLLCGSFPSLLFLLPLREPLLRHVLRRLCMCMCVFVCMCVCVCMYVTCFSVLFLFWYPIACLTLSRTLALTCACIRVCFVCC
jgi:hypothetical protein